jgi:TonB family protein
MPFQVSAGYGAVGLGLRCEFSPRYVKCMSNTSKDAEAPLVIADRRLCARKPTPSLVYVGMGENNGGIIVDTSDDGLAVASAAPLDSGGLVPLTFQVPGDNHRLEVNGEIVWISESKKRAGVRFVDPSEDTRNRIKRWIVPEVPAVEAPSEAVVAHEKTWRRLEMPDIPIFQGSPSQPASPDQVIQEDAQESRLAPIATPTLLSAGTLVAALAPRQRSPRLSYGKEDRQGVQAGDAKRRLVARTRSWGTLAAVIIVAASISFVAGWFTAGLRARSGPLGRFGKTKLQTSETAKSVESSPASSVTIVLGPLVQNLPPSTPRSSSAAVDVPGRAVSDARMDAHSNEPPPASSNTNGAVSSVHAVQPHVLESGAASPPTMDPRQQTERAQLPVPASVPSQPQDTSVTTAPGPSAKPPQIARAVGTTEQTSLPPKPAEMPELVKGSVSVSFSPYPSIRVPAALKTQMSRQGATLQIGKLLSRVDPVYPEEAEMQRMEGTVILHTVIGQDGTIQGVAAKSGPAPLVAAAANAVRQWRYTPSSVGGQPVEAEEDITITFRLLKQAGHPN